MLEPEEPRKVKGRVLGADLSAFSLEDLNEYIAELEAEIDRARADHARKQRAMGGAEALFGPRG